MNVTDKIIKINNHRQQNSFYSYSTEASLRYATQTITDLVPTGNSIQTCETSEYQCETNGITKSKFDYLKNICSQCLLQGIPFYVEIVGYCFLPQLARCNNWQKCYGISKNRNQWQVAPFFFNQRTPNSKFLGSILFTFQQRKNNSELLTPSEQNTDRESEILQSLFYLFLYLHNNKQVFYNAFYRNTSAYFLTPSYFTETILTVFLHIFCSRLKS